MEKVSQESYKQIITSGGYIILDFSSPGCAPCKKVPPLIEEIIAESPELKIKGYEVDVTENPELAQEYFVLGVPTIIILKDGKEIKRFNSVPGKAKIIKSIK